MPWWRLLSRQISRNGCWLKTSGIFRAGNIGVLRQHLNNRCFKIYILAGEVLQFPSSDVFKTYLKLWATWSDLTADPALMRRLDWSPLEVPSSLSGCDCACGLLPCLKAWTWSSPVVPLQVLALRVTPLQVLFISMVCFKQQLTFSSSVSCCLVLLLVKPWKRWLWLKPEERLHEGWGQDLVMQLEKELFSHPKLVSCFVLGWNQDISNER